MTTNSTAMSDSASLSTTLPEIAPTIDLPRAMTSKCQNCGHSPPSAEEAQLRIKDLEAQVRLLNTKAAAAVDRITDYEDEVRSLRESYANLQQQQQNQTQQHHPETHTVQIIPASIPPTPGFTPPPPPDPANTPTTPNNPSSPPRYPSRLASLSSFLPGRKRDTALLQATPPTPSAALFTPPLTSDPTLPMLDPTTYPSNTALQKLQTSLETERTLRLRAESNLNQTQSELEELTATLFGQANEMVAQERKARVKLEERVKILEDRDGEKRRRLERLEKALERIERVRGLMKLEEGKGEVRIGIEMLELSEESDARQLRVVNPASAPVPVAVVQS